MNPDNWVLVEIIGGLTQGSSPIFYGRMGSQAKPAYVGKPESTPDVVRVCYSLRVFVMHSMVQSPSVDIALEIHISVRLCRMDAKSKKL